ncbi:hypothetical protein Y032_0057g2732 [Ancylostoma ceylanicum]|uniref:Uncharacterized protein n=1 Tax=Ancylostoma ceylanicum TaxID=53326 RepID=A0A016U5F2_9BILA|nr:hypothetical protein Y032_0057g2732 [Ancylostoma ceylanicum]
MENGSMLLDQATASGATDAPVLGTMGTGVKWTTGWKENALRRIKGKPGITPKKELRIAAWNVRTGHQVGQKEIIARELTRCKISVADELLINGSGTATIKVPDNDQTMTLYYSGGDEH